MKQFPNASRGWLMTVLFYYSLLAPERFGACSPALGNCSFTCRRRPGPKDEAFDSNDGSGSVACGLGVFSGVWIPFVYLA